MDPISMILSGGMAAAGIGMELFGGSKAQTAASQINQYQQQILGNEQQANDIRQQVVANQARRRTIQNVRNVQMAAAQSRAFSVAGNSQFGSGAKAGQQMAASGGAFNQESIGQDLMSANQMFAVDRNINNLKAQIGNAQTNMYNDQAMMNLGGSMIGGAKAFGQLGGDFFGMFGGAKGTDVTGGLFS